MLTVFLLLAVAGGLLRLALQWGVAQTLRDHHRSFPGAGGCPRGAGNIA